MGIVTANVVLNFPDELSDALEGPPPDGPLGDDVEPNFDLVQPGRGGRGVVNMPAGVGSKPTFHRGMLVRPVVVNYLMDFEILRNIFVYNLEKIQIFLMTMPVSAFGDHRSGGNIQGGKKRC